MWDLFPGLKVRIGQDFNDYDKEPIRAGELLRFKELDHFAKEDGFTIRFEASTIRLCGLLPADQPMIENEGNQFFEPFPNLASLRAAYILIRKGMAAQHLRSRWETPILLGELKACGKWLTSKDPGEPPKCTNQALCRTLFSGPYDPATEALPFLIHFLYAGILRCPDRPGAAQTCI